MVTAAHIGTPLTAPLAPLTTAAVTGPAPAAVIGADPSAAELLAQVRALRDRLDALAEELHAAHRPWWRRWGNGATLPGERAERALREQARRQQRERHQQYALDHMLRSGVHAVR